MILKPLPNSLFPRAETVVKVPKTLMRHLPEEGNGRS